MICARLAKILCFTKVWLRRDPNKNKKDGKLVILAWEKKSIKLSCGSVFQAYDIQAACIHNSIPNGKILTALHQMTKKKHFADILSMEKGYGETVECREVL